MGIDEQNEKVEQLAKEVDEHIDTIEDTAKHDEASAQIDEQIEIPDKVEAINEKPDEGSVENQVPETGENS